MALANSMSIKEVDAHAPSQAPRSARKNIRTGILISQQVKWKTSPPWSMDAPSYWPGWQAGP